MIKWNNFELFKEELHNELTTNILPYWEKTPG
jgi:hypothetical protein